MRKAFHGGKMDDSNWRADGQLWPTIQPPLVPTGEDVRLILQAARPWLDELSAPPRILVLGVTSALLDAHWPEGSEIHSIDYDRTMIDLFWKDREGRQCHCDYWQSMPVPDAHFDLVVGDCSFNALSGLDQYRAVLTEISRVSRSGAPLVCRFFMQPQPRLTPESILAQAPGLTPSFVRLLLVLASAGDDGSLRFRNVRGVIIQEHGDFEGYLRRLGHDDADIERTKKVLLSDQRLNYPSREQIMREFGPFYSKIEFEYPGYDTGRYCPTVRFT